MRDEEEEVGGSPTDFLKKPILVLWESRSRALSCFMLPTKALSNAYGVRTAVRVIDQE